MKQLTPFAKFAWSVLLVNIFVILWGAFVRATGSGAGCGNHWPSCNGTVIPWSQQIETMIEFTHRLTSGVALILVIWLMVWAMRLFPPGHHIRTGAILSFVFITIEALVGAGLVLFELVAYNLSVARAIVVGVHLVNTFILLTVLTLTAWWASGKAPTHWSGRGGLGRAVLAGYVGLLLLGGSGAITALGDTLFPAASLMEGLQQDLSPTAHFLVQLRLYHPLIAIAIGVYTILLANFINARQATPTTRKIAKFFTILYVTQLIGGAFNVVLLAPIWMQIVHLLFADFLLITFVLFIATAFAQPLLKEDTVASPTTTKAGEQWLH